MRIIAGKFRSRRLKTIESSVVRPTTDRVRQTIFDVLTARVDFENANVLDCFAGSGLLGFEAVSRGAARVAFIEQNPKVAAHISDSIRLLQLETQATLHLTDAMRFVAETAERYHLIFADPPYDFRLYDKFLRKTFEHNLLLPSGYLVLEHGEKQSFASHERFAFQKNFGATVVSFFTIENASAD
ncbi:MAG: 16S rRNA (guanine(966)-N(2))-methyltransferase RsmD [Chloroherpetonaceae bacterium]